ncbi:radical SAM protein [Candidatus Woesearchaeota archaeon]|nr:radical SAM protein [Candidatus Woesearchaeota archaeon]MBW3005500.1 radical SAM protein [Candidatus Woesearchaeota archaeon]
MGVRIKTVHLEANNYCNLNCHFCFATFTPTGMNTEEVKGIIKKMAEHGSELFCFTGGDPLLRNDIAELVKYIKEQGLKSAIDTNGLLASEQGLIELEPSLDRISLPLDGDNAGTQYLMRGSHALYGKSIELMNTIDGLDIDLKINTLATRLNQDEIFNIGKIIESHNISQWSIFQFNPVNRGKQYQSELEISNDDFSRIEDKVRRYEFPFRVKFSRKKTEDTFFIISPQGIAYAVIKGENHPFGDLKTQDVEEVLANHPKLAQPSYT